METLAVFLAYIYTPGHVRKAIIFLAVVSHVDQVRGVEPSGPESWEV